MPCCGQNREQARTVTSPKPAQTAASRPVPPAPVRDQTVAPPVGPMARVRYTGVTEIVIRGTQSGRAYAFSAKAPERSVHKSDLDGLLRVGLFRRV